MKRISIFLIALICVLTLTSCKGKIESINVVESSVPTTINAKDLDSTLATIKVEVVDSKGNVETVSLTKDMISSDDYKKLSAYGTYTVTINYEGFSDNVTLNIVTDNYVVKVVYPGGAPVTSGVNVQWCTGNNCFLPVKSNADGIAEIELDNGDYYIHLESGIPSGYTYDPNAYTTNANNKYVEIELIPVVALTGDGTTTSTYKLSSVGAYKVSYDKAGTSGIKYFSFTASTSGKYTFKSIAMDKLALNAIDPYLGVLDATLDLSKVNTSGNITGNINFVYEFDVVAGETYYFAVIVSSASKFPAEFEVLLTK